MKHLQIKNIPPDLHEAVRRRAAQEGRTMSEYVIDVLRRDLAHPSQREWLARLSEREPVETGEDSAALVNAAREARKQELEAACRCR
jgi:plasmid stability protein